MEEDPEESPPPRPGLVGGDDADLLVDGHDHFVVDFHQVVLAARLGGGLARLADLRARRGEVGDERDALAFALQVVVAPFPLHAGGLDGDVRLRQFELLRQQPKRGDRDHDEDQHRHDRPGHLEQGVVSGLRRDGVRLLVEADHADADQHHHEEADHRDDGEQQVVVEAVDVARRRLMAQSCGASKCGVAGLGGRGIAALLSTRNI